MHRSTDGHQIEHNYTSGGAVMLRCCRVALKLSARGRGAGKPTMPDQQ